jgi:cyclopropane-fatty-acyl-phospholipid synthase
MTTDNNKNNKVDRPIWYEPLLDHGLIPDFVLRAAIRILLKERLNWINMNDLSKNYQRKLSFVNSLKEKSIAEHTDKANEQHYEVEKKKYALCARDMRS